VVWEEEDRVYPLGFAVSRKEFFMEIDVTFGIYTRVRSVGFEFDGAVDVDIFDGFV
jgi:hypothetical protein